MSLHQLILNADSSMKSIPLETRLQTSSRSHYFVAGNRYSLNDVEFGILRGNLLDNLPESFHKAARPQAILARFQASDPRSKIANGCTWKDPRISFALSIGTVSSPELHLHYPFTVYQELESETRRYLGKLVSVDAGNKKVVMPKLCEWHFKDFGKTYKKMARHLAEYFPPQQKSSYDPEFAVEFADFDETFQLDLKQFVISS